MRTYPIIAVGALLAACTHDGTPHVDLDAAADATEDTLAGDMVDDDVVSTDVLHDDAGPADVVEDDAGPADVVEDTMPPSCGFGYDLMFTSSGEAPPPQLVTERPPGTGDGSVAHAEPPPPFVYPVSLHKDLDEIVMPGYSDTMPLFERAQAWTTATRCYETPTGVRFLTEPEAYELYRGVAEATTGIPVDTTPGVRSVVGLRGAYPGTFAWHGNTPDRFNDTLVLMWIDLAGVHHVREWHGHTDVGARDFGWESSSSLRPNRRYHYVNGLHRDYSALRNTEAYYAVRDDTNNNGHWDSDRNGWLPPVDVQDYDRNGSAHNIHMASVDGPIGEARVQSWSAGCQTIPGMANWEEFIYSAWTNSGDPVKYFLVDVRDIPDSYWWPCTPDGSHQCPYEIDTFPFTHSDDTSLSTVSVFDEYSCLGLDESGPEVVYTFTVDTTTTLTATVDCEDPVVDIDVYLLDADDPDSCRARDHWEVSTTVTPGRYYIVADTYVDGAALSGPYTLTVDLG